MLSTQKIRRVWQRQTAYQAYLWFIIIAGFWLFIAALLQVPTYDPLLNFFLLLGLAAFAETATTSVQVSTKAGITFGVGTAVAMAAIPTFGILAAVLTVVVINVGVWLIKPKDKVTWKKSGIQLGFNSGMHSISVLLAGVVFTAVFQIFDPSHIITHILAWFLAAAVYDQINFWLIMIILRLQHGPEFNAWIPWRENLWAVPINILVMSAGGALMAYALARFDWLGILIFYVPVFLSAYAFRLYVKQMQDHMDNLEKIIAERTEALSNKAEELSELNKQKDVYLSILSHDIKTALSGLTVYASMMKEDPEIVLENPSISDDMMQSLRVVNDLVGDIVTLDRLESGRQLTLELETFRLHETIRSVLNSLRARALQKQIEMTWSSQNNDIWLNADRQYIERIILNLVSNAIKYTPRGGTVTITMRKDNTQAVVEIKDTGYGIPEEELPYIFERYSRVTNQSRRAAGFGLGLAIAKIYTEAHHGEIEVFSQENEGSTFTIKLPLHQTIPSEIVNTGRPSLLPAT